MHEHQLWFVIEQTASRWRRSTITSLDSRKDTAKPHCALASSPRDLLFAITDRPKHLIALRRWGTAEEGFAKKRVHVFPDDFSFFGNFEEAAERGLSDQCVAVRQALSVAHAWREEIPSRLVLVLPYNLVCGWIDLDHPRIRHRVIETVRPIIEY